MPIQKYEVNYIPLFYNDLEGIVGYIIDKLQNHQAAQKLLDDIENAIFERSFCAESFEPYPTTRKRELPYYTIYVKNYVIYYVVIDHRVMEVRRCLNKRQDRWRLI